jgi:hypothetical protein
MDGRNKMWGQEQTNGSGSLIIFQDSFLLSSATFKGPFSYTTLTGSLLVHPPSFSPHIIDYFSLHGLLFHPEDDGSKLQNTRTYLSNYMASQLRA